MGPSSALLFWSEKWKCTQPWTIKNKNWNLLTLLYFRSQSAYPLRSVRKALWVGKDCDMKVRPVRTLCALSANQHKAFLRNAEEETYGSCYPQNLPTERREKPFVRSHFFCYGTALPGLCCNQKSIGSIADVQLPYSPLNKVRKLASLVVLASYEGHKVGFWKRCIVIFPQILEQQIKFRREFWKRCNVIFPPV